MSSPFPRSPASSRCATQRRFGLLLVTSIGCVVGLLRWVGLRRFVVADRSMEPTLVDGQGLIGIRRSEARTGQMRTFEHPNREGFWLVKRVAAVSGDSMIVESDNTDVPTVDSNTFGPVDIAGSYRIVIRVPRRWMSSTLDGASARTAPVFDEFEGSLASGACLGTAE